MEVSGHVMAALLPEKEPPGTHFIGGWVGHRAGVATVKKWKIHIPSGNRTSAVQTRSSSLANSANEVTQSTAMDFQFGHKLLQQK
jgi:hypothetical protein